MKKILSIDGGGIRGIIPALVLAEIEKRTDKPISACFDLFAGTSTGGILSLGLTKADPFGRPEYSAADLAEIYASRGREIFARSLWKGFSSVGGLTDETYSDHGLEAVLEDYFKNTDLAKCLVKTMITTYDLEKREPLFLKSWRAEYADVLMRDAGRATAAAPTYFEPANIAVNGEPRVLVDGGIFVNNPAMSAYAEARRIFPEEPDILLLSLGTGELVRPIYYHEAKHWGKLEWVLPLLNCMFDGMADAVDYQLNNLLEAERYFRLQQSLTYASDDLDNATQGNISLLQQEAARLIQKHSLDLDKLCELIA